MEDKHNSSDKQTKNNEPANDVTKHTTPSETPHDIDETTAREDEYKEFNKNTVNPTPQTTTGH